MAKAKFAVKQDPENEVPAEVLAKAIIDVDAGFKRMKAAMLDEKAIVLLVQHSAGTSFVSQAQVKAVLHAAASLKETYIKSPKKNG